MFDFPVCIVDVETTGFNPKRARIIELAVLRIENGEITDSLSTLINPGIKIPDYITALTSIDSRGVGSAPYFADIAEDLMRILDGCVFLAHNVNFDYSFVKTELKRCGFVFNSKNLCSVKISRRLYSQYRKHSLEQIIARHNIFPENRHRAYDDAKSVLDFLRIAEQEHKNNFHACIEQLLKNHSLPDQLITDVQSIKSQHGVYIFRDTTGHPIYVGKSNNVRQRVKSHFLQAKNDSKENRIAQKVQNVEVINTDTELEALLLESKLIKEYQPVHNVRLRRKRQLVVLTGEENENGYIELKLSRVDTSEIDLSVGIYGVFNNVTKAKSFLKQACDEYQLCSKLLNIEKTQRSCFRHQLKKCLGACIALEASEDYNERVSQAFENARLQNWSYSGPVIFELTEHKSLIVDNWKVSGEILNGVRNDAIDSFDFDLDSYKILKSFFEKYPDKVKTLN